MASSELDTMESSLLIQTFLFFLKCIPVDNDIDACVFKHRRGTPNKVHR